MRVLFSPMGSNGDIRPSIALAVGLIKNNCEVKFIVPKNGVGLCKKYNIPFTDIDYDYYDSMSLMLRLFKKEKIQKSDLVEHLRKEINAQFEGIKNETEDYDIILNGTRNYATMSYAEILKKPHYHIRYLPGVITSKYDPPWSCEYMGLPLILNRIFWSKHNIRDNIINSMLISPLRKELGLKPYKNFAKLWQDNTVLAVDKGLYKIPNDVKVKSYQVNYPHLFDESEKLSRDINEFINAGKPVIYFGFGSMPNTKSIEDSVEFLKKIAVELNVKFIMCKDIIENKSYNDSDILTIDDTPHLKLFPKMSLVVHHGGSGTTHTAALSGVPQLIISHFADQFYWGYKIEKMCLGKTFKLNRFNFDMLKKSIKFILENKAIKFNCKEFGFKLYERSSIEDLVKELPFMKK